MEFLVDFSKILLSTLRDVSPIIILITCFQLFVLRQPIPHLRRVVVGVAYVIVGLALFLAGLDKALFPLGKIMATQLSDPAFIYGQDVPVDTVDGGVLENITQVFDSDCTQSWTCPDKLYLQQTKYDFVTIGDERLYIPPVVGYDYNDFDANQDCEISITEMGAALDAWYAGTIEMSDMGEVLDLWYQGTYC